MNTPSADDLDLGPTVRGFSSGQKLFGRYTLKAVLGRGGMGVVWRAFDETLERDVALKFLPELIIHDHAVLDDLKRETRRSLELTHHNIVRIHDFAQDAQSACISMEYVDGPTLSALRIERSNRVFEVEELSPLIEQCCEALEYAHTRAKIVHRDLKPSNLMLNSKRELKIADFGIARSLSDSASMLTMAHGTSGTLVYMSPQQLDGQRASHLDDIYSLGATIYELLTGKPPFYSGDIERQIHERVPPPIAERRGELGITSGPATVQAWEETVAACLAKDPVRRPQSAAEAARRLAVRDGICPAIGVSKTPVTVGGTAHPAYRRKGLIGIMALLCLAILAAAYLMKQPQEKVSGRDTTGPRYITGTLVIHTIPSDAKVAIDGVTKGGGGRFEGTRPGQCVVRVEADGYDPVEKIFPVVAGETTEPDIIRLTRSTGKVVIGSHAEGLSFVLTDADGHVTRGKTPVTLAGVVTGRAEVIFGTPGLSQNTAPVTVLRDISTTLVAPRYEINEAERALIGRWRLWHSAGIKTGAGTITFRIAEDGRLLANGDFETDGKVDQQEEKLVNGATYSYSGRINGLDSPEVSGGGVADGHYAHMFTNAAGKRYWKMALRGEFRWTLNPGPEGKRQGLKPISGSSDTAEFSLPSGNQSIALWPPPSSGMNVPAIAAPTLEKL